MGCTWSEINTQTYTGRELTSYVTPQDIRLVKQSWAIVGYDLSGAGVMIFEKLFENNKDLKTLFYKLMKNSSNGNLEADSDKLRNHSLIVMEGLGAAVESLEDSVFLTNVLIAMGERHASYNVKPEMLLLLWPAIRDTFREKLGDEFTEDVALGWTHVFEYLRYHFQEGIRRGNKKKRAQE